MSTPLESAPPLLTLEQAERFVQTSGYFFSPEVQTRLETLRVPLSCIDDRAPHREEDERHLAIPGCRLGLVKDTFGGLNLGGIIFDHQVVTDAIERVVGIPSFHTDRNKVEERDPLCCAGCGHCAGALEKPEAYLLKEKDVRFLKEYYLHHLVGNREVEPAIYEGEHNASAVFVVRGFRAGLHPTDGKFQAYTYHIDWHYRMLDAISEEVAKALGEVFTTIRDLLHRSAEMRFGETAAHLAKDKPVFEVRDKEGRLIVTPKE